MEGSNSRGIERLSSKQVEAWRKKTGMKPGTKLADGGGLYLVRLPSGSASGQIKFKVNRADPWAKMFPVGPAAVTSLADAVPGAAGGGATEG